MWVVELVCLEMEGSWKLLPNHYFPEASVYHGLDQLLNLDLRNEVLTTSTHSARDLLCDFNFNSLEYFFGYAHEKSQSLYVLGGRKGNILHAYVIHMYVAI